jgi:hypothetical protein
MQTCLPSAGNTGLLLDAVCLASGLSQLQKCRFPPVGEGLGEAVFKRKQCEKEPQGDHALDGDGPPPQAPTELPEAEAWTLLPGCAGRKLQECPEGVKEHIVGNMGFQHGFVCELCAVTSSK